MRGSAPVRRLVRETHVTRNDLIYPLFVTHGSSAPIPSMPGILRFSLEDLMAEVESVAKLGIPGVMLFGIPDSKDERGSGAYAEDGIVPTAIRKLRKEVGDAVAIVPDLCLCEYTSHGHCGLVENGDVANDPTLALLAEAAVVYAQSGAAIIAPSDMMDGRVAAIRAALDQSGFSNLPIMAYSAKYASAYYGPFREAADSAPQFGDRRTYQMDPANRREAIREVELDIEEGADIVMVKPALAYLDVIREVRDRFDVPVAAYNVSGEYAMVKAAAQNGWIDEDRVIRETLTSIKRAGADVILTDHAKELAERSLEEQRL